MKKIICFILIFLFLSTCFSQNTSFVLKTIDTLSSEYFYGRGYVKDGLQKSACYLSSQFQQIGLSAFNNNYFQTLSYPVNTFPFTPLIIHKNDTLIPGKEYSIVPYSCSIKGLFPVVYLNKNTLYDKSKTNKFLNKNFRDKILIIDDYGISSKEDIIFFNTLETNPLKAKAIIRLTDDSLSGGLASFSSFYTSIIAKRNSLPNNIKNLYLEISNKFIPDYSTHNIIGYIQGQIQPDSFIVFSAHYDHLGGIGNNSYYPGALDNAAGIGMLLDLANHFMNNKNQLKYSIVFIAFTGEELGLLGSQYFAENPLFNLSKIRFYINIDMIGTGEEGIKVINANVFKKEFDLLQSLNSKHNYLSSIGIRGPAKNSDHYSLYEKGVPCFYIYTIGKPLPYHSINDKLLNIPFTAYNGLFKLLTDFSYHL